MKTMENPYNIKDHPMHLFQFNNVATGTTIGLSAIERDRQPWFVAGDICKALGLKNSRQALAKLEADQKGVTTMDTPGGRQQVSIINESGLYSLTLTSRKAEARQFKKWITSVVIPSIRQHGGYINGQEALSGHDQVETLQAIQQEALRVRERHYEEKYDRSVILKNLRRLG